MLIKALVIVAYIRTIMVQKELMKKNKQISQLRNTLLLVRLQQVEENEIKLMNELVILKENKKKRRIKVRKNNSQLVNICMKKIK